MTLHPQSRSFLDALIAADAPNWPEMELSEARSTFDALPFFGEAPEVAEVIDADIAGVDVRIYKPKRDDEPTDTDPDVIVYFHGGGWVLGSIASHDVLCRKLANRSGAAVVSVGYRQPPEAPFPAAVEDCFTVCDVLSMDHATYGFTDRLLVAGDSAGGNLSAAVALMARDRGGPVLAGQMLIYPVLDSMMSGDTYRRFAEGFGLTASTMNWFWRNYTGDTDSKKRTSPLASPTHAEDLSGLPPTHVMTVEYDVLRSEADVFAKRLVDAGVPTTTSHYKGMLHGFVHFAEPFDDAEPAIADIARCCREMLNAK